ncbi:N-acyl homoserine lactonase family protein [Actinobacteria bacterium YIM 96077]|uniref:N-acyl homoserine lactonase family protein n=2 Tax=Phytoactinopolyspora halophila TaxID=1981511 RepID=A0A329QX23_9ACTN|nr:N-acyl homoserine lactonase family protein [Actinobacteria bacterium YIM 96077]RAW16526.1 N-acyl homoserine lactonase family protein [Phytoactinopolyspora halophila]
MGGTPTDPIARVAVFSTGTVRMHPEHVGPTRKPTPVWLLTSRRWTEPRPINVFVVEHRDGLVLFDTGQDPASVTDPDYFPGRANKLVNARMAKIHLDPSDTVEANLARLGYRIADVGTAVLSHLHPDHVGGLPVLRHANIVVSRSEWDTLQVPRPQMRGIYRSHIDMPGLTWKLITPEPLGDPDLAPFHEGYDLFDDGSVVLLSTPGHTPGSLSMLVRRTDRAPLLLVGDLTYDARLLAAGQPSGLCDKRVTRSVMEKVNALRYTWPDMAVLPAHDPGSASRLAAAVA